MAALWKVRVLEVDGPSVRVEVRQAHPDAGAFSGSRAFALRLLHEQAWDLGGGSRMAYRALGPLGEAADNKQVLDDDWVAAHVDELIADVAVEDTTATTLDEHAAVQQVAARLGISADLDALSEDDRARFDEAYEQLWQDVDALPARRYRITVTRPELLAHLRPGAAWASAAY